MEVTLLQHMGSDDSIVNAARVSFSKLANQYTPEQNKSLLFFLARGQTEREYSHRVNQLDIGTDSITDATKLLWDIKNTDTHWTPFAQTAITLHCKAPISIVRHLYKHKVGLVENEVSRRYVSDTPEFFIPKSFRAKPVGSVKQGSGGTHKDNQFWLDVYINRCMEAVKTYDSMIEAGICAEQARFVLPQSMYTEWHWTGSLYALASVVNKRRNPHAQQEVQDFANLVDSVIAPLFPIGWAALTSY